MSKSIIFFLFLSTCDLFGQNETQSTLFTSNYTSFNPAMSGLRYNNEANILWRNQWTQVNGAPADLWINYTQRVSKIHGAAGVTYNYDYIGFIKTHTALANYAFHLQGKKILWSLGVAAGIQSVSYTLNSPYYPGGTAFQSTAGIALHAEDWNAGFSVSQLNSFIYRNNQSSIAYNTTPTYHLHGDYTLRFGEKWKLTPAIHFFSDLIKVANTTSVKASYNDRLWFGVNSWNLFSPEAGKSFGPMLGYDFKGKYRMGYSLEFYEQSKFYDDVNLTHEIVLSLLLK